MTTQSNTLEGRIAIVTGAASPIGMGRSITTGLVRAGARVAMLDVNEDWLDQSANDMREIGGDDAVLFLEILQRVEGMRGQPGDRGVQSPAGDDQ